MGDREAASRELSLGVLQVWQALTETVSRRPANPEVTLVFTDLVGFSTWSLQAGDEAALALLRQVARAVEPPLLDAGGIMVSSSSLDLIPQSELDALGVDAKRARKPVFAAKPSGVPADLAIYRLRTLRDLTASDHTSETN
jgi:class 3 adenylate cyclase